jgi:hypothetical protein
MNPTKTSLYTTPKPDPNPYKLNICDAHNRNGWIIPRPGCKHCGNALPLKLGNVVNPIVIAQLVSWHADIHHWEHIAKMPGEVICFKRYLAEMCKKIYGKQWPMPSYETHDPEKFPTTIPL